MHTAQAAPGQRRPRALPGMRPVDCSAALPLHPALAAMPTAAWLCSTLAAQPLPALHQVLVQPPNTQCACLQCTATSQCDQISVNPHQHS